MSFREDWQKEMKQMQLTKRQKDKIVVAVQRGDKAIRKDWRYPVVLSSFIAAAFLFIFLTLQSTSVTTPGTASYQGVAAEETFNADFYEIIAWFGAVAVFAILAAVQLVLVIFQTGRWNQKAWVIHARLYLRMQKRYLMVHLMAVVLAVLTFGFWFGYPLIYFTSLFETGSLQVSTIISVAIVTSYLLYIHYRIAIRVSEKNRIGRMLWYQIMVIAVITLWLLAVTTVFITEAPVDVLITWFVIVVAINYCLWSLWMIRDEKPATCPHCGCTFSKREMLKKSFWGYKAKCGQCGGEIYVTRKARKKLDFISWFFPGTFILLSNLGLWSSLGCMVASTVFILFVVTPYTTKFSSENEPLW